MSITNDWTAAARGFRARAGFRAIWQLSPTARTHARDAPRAVIALVKFTSCFFSFSSSSITTSIASLFKHVSSALTVLVARV